MRATSVSAGTVQFLVDGERAGDTIRLDARGRAVWKTTQLGAGKHTVVASYVPTAGGAFSSATSAEELHVVTGKD